MSRRDENEFLPADFRVGTDPNAKGDAFSEYNLCFDLGFDGVFSDQSDTAVQARDWWLEHQTARAHAHSPPLKATAGPVGRLRPRDG